MSEHSDPILIHNEQLKLFATFMSAVAFAILGYAVLDPIFEGSGELTVLTVFYSLCGFGVLGGAMGLLWLLRRPLP